MRVLGIDPGIHCGFALIGETAQDVMCGEWDLSGRKWEGAGWRYVRLETAIREAIEKHGVTHVGIEEVRRHEGTDAAHVYGAITGIITKVCEQTETPYTSWTPGEIKRAATGKGNAGKELVLQAAKKRWPNVPIRTDNEADALWIAELTRQEVA
jgi:Holliday junction resolvasome RuvABC endonuclease subunit